MLPSFTGEAVSLAATLLLNFFRLNFLGDLAAKAGWVTLRAFSSET